jgi:hypothetical protein
MNKRGSIVTQRGVGENAGLGSVSEAEEEAGYPLQPAASGLCRRLPLRDSS